MMHTFYRVDGSEFRVRADVHFDADARVIGTDRDVALVKVSSTSSLRKFLGGETVGLGRYAKVAIVK